MDVITNYLPTWKHLVAVTMAGFGLLAPPADAEELGSCVVDKSSTSAAVVCAIAPGTGLKLVTITVKTGTPDGTGPATMIINNPNADPVNEVLDLDEVNLVIEDDFAYGIWFEDINFDGYVDFAVTEFIPAASCGAERSAPLLAVQSGVVEVRGQRIAATDHLAIDRSRTQTA